MNVAQFIELSERVIEIYNHSPIEKRYSRLVALLQEHINGPNQSTTEALSTSLKELQAVVEAANLNEFPTTMLPLAQELGLDEFLSDQLFRFPERLIRDSGPILTDALQQITSHRDELVARLENLRNARNSITNLGYPESKLEPGESEISFIIPREVFDNELSQFSKYLDLFRKLIECYSEVATGSREKLNLKSISTSDPMVVVAASAGVVLLTLRIAHSIVDLWRKVAEIREIQERTRLLSLDKSISESIGEAIKKKVSEGLTEALTKATGNATLNPELSTQARVLTEKMAALIDRGARIDGWAEQPQESEENEQEARIFEEIRRIGSEMRRIAAAGEQLLQLPPPIGEASEE